MRNQKIFYAVLAPGADEIRGQCISLVDIAANFADPFSLLGRFGLGLVALFGVIYPAVMILGHKAFGSKLTMREILRKI